MLRFAAIASLTHASLLDIPWPPPMTGMHCQLVLEHPDNVFGGIEIGTYVGFNTPQGVKHGLVNSYNLTTGRFSIREGPFKYTFCHEDLIPLANQPEVATIAEPTMQEWAAFLQSMGLSSTKLDSSGVLSLPAPLIHQSD